MPNTVWSEASQLLLFHTGVAIEMEYGPYVSWSYMWGGHPSIQYAIPNFFNFSADIGLIHDYQYSNSDFMDLLKNELDNGRPMLYRGEDPNTGGHFWNIDGYDDNDLFHCNCICLVVHSCTTVFGVDSNRHKPKITHSFYCFGWEFVFLIGHVGYWFQFIVCKITARFTQEAVFICQGSNA